MTVNYFQYTTDQLHEALRILDAAIAEQGTKQLLDHRKELIQFFIDYVGYNPDNLCTTSSNTNK